MLTLNLLRTHTTREIMHTTSAIVLADQLPAVSVVVNCLTATDCSTAIGQK
jgi:hypothetical protein